MEKDLKEHEDINLHVSKRFIGITIYLLLAFGSWGYLVHRYSKYPELSGIDIAIPFVILFLVILALPIYSGVSD